MAETEECWERACFWMAEVMEMHSEMTSETGSTATDTGRLRYCMRGVSRVAIAAEPRDREASMVLDARASRFMVFGILAVAGCGQPRRVYAQRLVCLPFRTKERSRTQPTTNITNKRVLGAAEVGGSRASTSRGSRLEDRAASSLTPALPLDVQRCRPSSVMIGPHFKAIDPRHSGGGFDLVDQEFILER